MVNDRRLAVLLRRPGVIPVALVFLTLLVYANSFPGSFILDDIIIVQQNRLVQHPDLFTLFTSDYWHGIENSGLFRPLTILSLAVNRFLTGEGAWGFHLVNLLLHAGVVLLLWRTLLVWGGSRLAAGLAALLFALHPLHVEVVNVVVGRSELLVAFFLLAAFLAAQRSGARASWLVGLCYLLALLSKENAITFLGLLPLWDFFHEGQGSWRRRWPLYAGLFAVTVCWLLWRQYGVINPLPPFELAEAAAPLAYVPVTTRILTALQLQWLYLGKLFIPVGLQSVYSLADLPPFVTSVFSWRGVAVIGASVGAVLLLVRGWRRQSLVTLFAISYLLAFAPTANLFFPIGVSFAERLAYFPSLWYCAAMGALLATPLPQQHWRNWGRMLGVAYLLFLGAVLLVRTPDYASELRLWEAEVAENPRDFLGWQSLAQNLSALRRPEEADRAFQTMLALAPDYPAGLRSYTAFLLIWGRSAEALVPARRVYALSASKGDVLGMAFDGLDMAEVLLEVGQCTEALGYLDGPSRPLQNSRSAELRGGVFSCLGQDKEAVEWFARVNGPSPQLRSYYWHGLSLYRLRRLEEARRQLEEAVSGREDAEAWNLLGAICAEQSDWPAALAAFAQAVEIDPENFRYRENLQRAQDRR